MDHQAFAQLLGNYGEFVGAIAVVVALGYLAVRIRQNTRTVSLNRGQAGAAEFSQVHEQIFGNADLASLIAQCRNPEASELSPGDEERVRRFANHCVNVYASVDDASKRGELEPVVYQTYCEDFLMTISDYPSLVPYLQTIVGHFPAYQHGIFKPLFCS